MLHFFKKSYTPEEKKKIRFLQRCHLFRHLKDDEVHELLPYLFLRNYRKGEVIFFRGDPSQGIYIIKRGVVSLTIDIEDKFEELNRLKASESFGDNALLEQRSRIYNAICFSELADIYIIPSNNILQMFEENKSIKAKVMTAMADNYEAYMSNLFKSYQEAFGFFDLSLAFKDSI